MCTYTLAVRMYGFTTKTFNLLQRFIEYLSLMSPQSISLSNERGHTTQSRAKYQGDHITRWSRSSLSSSSTGIDRANLRTRHLRS